MSTEFKFGAIAGTAVAVYVLLEFFLGFHTTTFEVGQYTGYFSSIIPLIVLYIGIKEKRDNVLGGRLSLGRGIGTGILISIIAAAIITAFMFIYNKFINPQFIDLGIVYERDKLIAAGIPDEIIVQKVNEMRLRYGIGTQIIGAFFGSVIIGAISSVILSVILKTNTPKQHPPSTMKSSDFL